MKTRQGFVSNSSSSSFIIAYATIKDGQENKVQKLFGDNRMIRISKANENGHHGQWDGSLSAFTPYGDEVLIKNVNPDKHVLKLYDTVDLYPEEPGEEEYLSEDHEEAEKLLNEICGMRGEIFEEIESFTWAGRDG